MRNDRRRKSSAKSLPGGPLVPQQVNDSSAFQPTQSISTPLPTDRYGLISVQNGSDTSLDYINDTFPKIDRQTLEPCQQYSHQQTVTPRSQSLNLDVTRSAANRHPRRNRRDASFNSSLLIKAYLKNPVNPVPCPSLLKSYIPLAMNEESPRASGSSRIPVGRSSSSSSSTSSSSRTESIQPIVERCSPPRLNGPFLRIGSNDDYDSRRVDNLFYGPVDPILVDPTIDHPIYYTFPGLDEAVTTPIHCCEGDLFDPVILHPSFTSISHTSIPPLFSSPEPPPFSMISLDSNSHLLLNNNSHLPPWEAKKGIGPPHVH
ncbi:hypothetical protein MJO28_016603 [Puccinia striiformis f. sp. tritici]|uniref:Uncharacterized protein n=2 Tax=Puccinia striiformis f. sp. tritici TaxID=168172 RepID=A0A0L0UVB1_9BASI|nr:hypothetical protein Pst134EA_030310 [Puccinia striiformis f. sp. tritici]KAI9600358.1 hypothetical protein H4Q26_000138 [Puccinia striiformis f. sp. tritici PST-130]KNE90704.1 hypothetical protein PSTG_15856 [Puccinia striiformis f. sp. tritici PST-78]KAH9446390.1 hypothetical protein Pst134EA_030310 [Puccinia striiformis f. sp. tritici]KAI7934776.1 hypothetical protein MJO29_016039 [Puccinia striiformis f. sp. tritici]KAI7935732.1 hypothetical protein MJO28_016603 [Puccinia striiformis f.